MKVLLDANLLVLLVVGVTDPTLISKHKRTRTFLEADFDLLVELLANFNRIVVTPHVLAEVSNLISQVGEPALTAIRKTFSSFVQSYEEIYVRSWEGVQHPAFLRLGLTDAAILHIADAELSLLTTDLGLYLEASRTNPRAVNFNHLRQGRLLGGQSL